MRNFTGFAVALTTFATLATFATSAAAQEVPAERQSPVADVPVNTPSGRFGLPHQLAISSDAGFTLSSTSVDGVEGTTDTLTLRPAVDFFVIENLSVGGFLGLDYTTTPGGSATVFSVGPRVGYNFPASSWFSIWPKAGLSFATSSVEEDDTTLPSGDVIEGADASSQSLQLNLFIPAMFHPVEHFFLGLGPSFDLDLTGDNKVSIVAIRLTLGGWI